MDSLAPLAALVVLFAFTIAAAVFGADSRDSIADDHRR